MTKGIWLLTTESAEYLVDWSAHCFLRTPLFREDGTVHVTVNDGRWRDFESLDIEPGLGEPARFEFLSGAREETEPASFWGWLPGARALADGSVAVSNGVIRVVHEPHACEPSNSRSAGCWVHRPTDHHMAAWPIVWYEDRSVAERICVHGIGHPDPDYEAFARERASRSARGHMHACDGCCSAH